MKMTSPTIWQRFKLHRLHRQADDLLKRVEYMNRKRRFYEQARAHYQAQLAAVQKRIIAIKGLWT